MSTPSLPHANRRLLRHGRVLEWLTLAWNVVSVLILTYLAVTASSVALAGFDLDSVIEIGASAVVLWELSGTGVARQRVALRLIAFAFLALAAYLTLQSLIALLVVHRASSSLGGIVWTAATTAVMFSLATFKGRTGRAVNNPVLITESRVTFIDGLLAGTVLIGITLNATLGWWWADPLAGFVIAVYAIREAVQIFRALREGTAGTD